MRHFSKKLNNDFFEDLKSYILSYNEIKSDKHSKVVEAAFEAADECFEATMPVSVSMQEPKVCAKASLFEMDFSNKKPSFSENLFKIIDAKGIKDSSVYKKADIDRRLFSKIRSDLNYHPAKNTAIKLCLALEQDIPETEQLLETAGYCLSLSDTSDLIVRYCIEHKIFDTIVTP